MINARVEQRLLIVVVALLLCGVVMVYSASDLLANTRYGDRFHFLKKELVLAVVGLAGLGLAARIPYQRWQVWARPMILAALALLVFVLIPGVGVAVHGARRWLRLPGFAFQPSELAKLAVMVYLAAYLTRRGGRIRTWRGLLPPLLLVGLIMGLIMAEPDLGTAAAIGLFTFGLLLLGGARWRHVALPGLVALAVLYVMVFQFGYKRARVEAYLNPGQSAQGSGFQVDQAQLALGEGGLIGVGPGQGQQKLYFLPEPHTDFIFAILGEEWGLLGASLVLLLYATLAWLGLAIALKTNEPFGRFLAAGLTLMVTCQALVNLGVVTGLLPAKGLPLPLISYGGSSLLVTLWAMGMLLNVSTRRG